MQQYQQHQSVRALFKVDLQLGPLQTTPVTQPLNLISTRTASVTDSAAETFSETGHREALRAGTGYVGNRNPAHKWSDSSQVHIFFNHCLWVCVSEAVRLECFFPLDPKPFSSLTVADCSYRPV